MKFGPPSPGALADPRFSTQYTIYPNMEMALSKNAHPMLLRSFMFSVERQSPAAGSGLRG